MTARLPVPGQDDGTWGSILNEFLEVSLNTDGTLQTSAVQQAGGITNVNGKNPANGSVTITANDVNAISSSSIGVANGIASLNSSTQVPLTQLGGGTASISNFLRGDGTWAVPSGSVSLDSVASDIQPLGMQAAGNSGLAADAKHVHAMPRLDQINNPTAGISLNSQKITNLQNGTNAQDAAAFGQIPTALPPNGTAGGDLTGTYPSPTVAKVNGITLPTSAPTGSGQVLTSTGTSTTSWQTPSSAPVSSVFGRTGTVTAQSGDYTAAEVGALPSGDDLSAIASTNATAGNVSMNNYKITSLANGSSASDAAAFGQIPVAGSGITNTSGTWSVNGAVPTGTAGGDLSGTYPNPTVSKASKAFTSGVASLTDGNNISIDVSQGNTFTLTLTGNHTLSSPTNPTDGQRIVIEVTQDSVGGRSLSFGAAYTFTASMPSPALSVTPSVTDYLAFTYSNASELWTMTGLMTSDAVPLPISQGGTGANSAPAALNALSAASLNGATFLGYTAPAVATLTDAASISVNAASGNLFTVTLGGNRTLANPTNPINGQKITFAITQPASGGPYSLSYGSAFTFLPSLSQPSLSVTPGATDYLSFLYNSTAAKWTLVEALISDIRSGANLGVFGDGSDSTATLDGSTSVSWATLSGSTYTMSRDCFCTKITVNNGVTLVPLGFRIFCAGIVTNNGTIANNGASATSATGGTVATGTVPAAGVVSGGSGGTGAGSSATIQTTASSNGGTGGSGSNGAGGNGFTFGGPISTFRSTGPVLSGSFSISSSVQPLHGGAGGGGGGGDGTNSGGGGGSGGLLIMILAYALINNGSMTTNGGGGYTPTTGNCGGGGGGSAGNVLVYTLTAMSGTGTTTMNGGSGGTKSGTGTNGGSGGSGTLLNVILK